VRQCQKELHRWERETKGRILNVEDVVKSPTTEAGDTVLHVDLEKAEE